ncbi:MAG: lipocalin family protein [Bryobacteraceae bacterium]|nr:lipocalin family protein [Bryobacteraceae bacterium]
MRWILACLSCAAAAGAAPPQTVSSVDLSRYQGVWYEIARYPNRFQRDCAGEVTATYELRDDGKVRVVNRCRKQNGALSEAEGVARPAKDGSNAKLQVRFAPAILSFLPQVWGDYWVIELAPDYSHAVVGHPAREYLWILGRSPNMDEETYGELVRRIEQKHGYDPARLIRTRQQ